MAWVAAVGLSWLVVMANVVEVAGQVRDASDGWHIPESAATEQSPLPASMAVIARGKGLYQSKCQRCHGPDGVRTRAGSGSGSSAGRFDGRASSLQESGRRDVLQDLERTREAQDAGHEVGGPGRGCVGDRAVRQNAAEIESQPTGNARQNSLRRPPKAYKITAS